MRGAKIAGARPRAACGVTYSWRYRSFRRHRPQAARQPRAPSHANLALRMEPLSPQVMHKLVFTILVHGLPDAQTALAFELLTEAQRNANPQVRELAVVAIAELPVSPSKRVAALARSMQDPSARVRRRAARALGDFGMHAVPALQVLASGLRDLDASVRRDSAGTLGRLGVAAASAATGLVALLADPDVRTRAVVATAIKRVGEPAI